MAKEVRRSERDKKAIARGDHSSCIKLMNDALEDQGIELATGFQMNFSSGDSRTLIYLPLIRISSGRATKQTVVAQFCPVCGKEQKPLGT